ncbi:hypothetical protein H5410_046130 [Solanum commersonii]|uniref:Uncharacterized protein n=1 Tax=Solanum commersonii TaxID=4109 RepID=A0A9J5XFM8_SOLCO|nr:hypothetical protein H5410_046130 [Solanum commersonii]
MTFGEPPSAFGDLRLLAESYRTQHQLKHEIEGEMGTFGESPSGLTSSTQLANRPNMPTFNPSSRIQPRNPRKKIKT